jgi:hypothetical protein
MITKQKYAEYLISTRQDEKRPFPREAHPCVEEDLLHHAEKQPFGESE